MCFHYYSDLVFTGDSCRIWPISSSAQQKVEVQEGGVLYLGTMELGVPEQSPLSSQGGIEMPLPRGRMPIRVFAHKRLREVSKACWEPLMEAEKSSTSLC